MPLLHSLVQSSPCHNKYRMAHLLSFHFIKYHLLITLKSGSGKKKNFLKMTDNMTKNRSTEDPAGGVGSGWSEHTWHRTVAGIQVSDMHAAAHLSRWRVVGALDPDVDLPSRGAQGLPVPRWLPGAPLLSSPSTGGIPRVVYTSGQQCTFSSGQCNTAQ